MAELEQPIIIKKINKVEDGHHGGAWKVAYADFVTAMMAFFLMLWLLSSASDGQLEGIADYFTPTIGLQGEMGIGFDGGESNELEEGNKKNNLTRPGIVSGQPPQGIKPGTPKKRATIESPEGEDLLFQQRGRAIKEIMARNGDLNKFSDNVLVEQTPEGLKIQLLDTDKESMFKPGGTSLTKTGKTLLDKMTDIIRGLPNHVSITGHTDAVPFTARKNYSNWELSTERANAARRHMLARGMIDERVAKVQGRADKELLLQNDPKSAKNRRIEIILIRGSHIGASGEVSPVSAIGGVLPSENTRGDIINFEDAGAVPEGQENSVREIPAGDLDERPNLVPEDAGLDADPLDALQYTP